MGTARVVSRIAAVLLCSLAGCYSSTSGTKLDRTQVDTIQRGVTTRGQVEEKFGAPDSMNIMPDGRRSATWNYTEVKARAKGTSFIPIAGAFMGGSTADTARQSLQIIYNKSDIVDDFVYSGSTGTQDNNRGMFGGSSESKTVADQPASAR